MRSLNKQQSGFTLVEMIIVIVITGIIGGIVAMFIKAPVQGYVDSARRAELTDIADNAVRRLARDVRTAVPNSIRADAAGLYVEFLPTKDGGRYRAIGAGDVLDFVAPDTTFDILGPASVFAVGDQIVVGSIQSDGNPPYQDPTSATGIRRAVTSAGSLNNVTVTSTAALPAFSRLWDASPPSQRFDVVDATQQAVTYACEGTPGTDASGNGQGRLIRHSGYGFNPVQVAPASLTTGVSAILADKVSACSMQYDLPNQRFGLMAVRLTITSGGESVTLYNEIHVSNAP
jgi:MSHA biogenesis protein MshO